MNRKQFYRERLASTLLAILLCMFGGALAGAPVSAQRHPLSDEAFQALSLQLSEKAGIFDSDNLISNESSFLNVVPKLEELARKGEAYIGVGPAQNFTYIAHTEPRIAFILDIRRNNLLLHLYLKQLFQESRDRWDYLSLLFGKPLPRGFVKNPAAAPRELAERFRAFPSERSYFKRNFERAWKTLRKRFPRLVSKGDRMILYRLASNFYLDNLDLKFRSRGRPPRPYYPDFEQLMTAEDPLGQPSHFLGSRLLFRRVKKLQDENRVLPVVGDFSGDKALKAVASEVRSRHLVVSVFYTSNVEFYLFRSGAFFRFLRNVEQLPVDRNSLIVRSYFSYWRPHPQADPGEFVASLLEGIQSLLKQNRKDPYLSYWDLVTRDYIPWRPVPEVGH